MSYISTHFARIMLHVQLVYSAGSAVVAITSIQDIAHATTPIWWGGILGLMLIALGTGGIKVHI